MDNKCCLTASVSVCLSVCLPVCLSVASEAYIMTVS